MALGDGIRRNVAKISQEERDRLREAFKKLDATKIYPDGVSYWDKQDQIHQATHVHGGPAFLTWHRELCNRLEALLREVDPQLSLHYWDWTTDPRASSDGAGGTVNLFTSSFMGSASGRAGVPFDTFDNNGVFAGSRNDTDNPADPPQEITRNVAPGAPSIPSDATIISTGDSEPIQDQYNRFRQALESTHDSTHGYIGGTLGNPHASFEDPFVYLLHSNADRLLAMWQTALGKAWRLDPNQVYGNEGNHPAILENLEPWAGGTGTRPWAPPENEQEIKNSRHPSIVAPPCYDTLPTYPTVVTQETMSITFNDVPEGETTVRAAVFSVKSCHDAHFQIVSGPTVLSGPAGTIFGTPLGIAITVRPSIDFTTPKGRLWISYTGTSDGDTATGTVTIRCIETNEDFVIPIVAETIKRPTVAVVMVLDKSGSMNEDAGDGRKRIDVLRDSALPFVDLIQENNAIGIVSFDQDAYDVMPVTPVGPPVFGSGRTTAKSNVSSHTPNPSGSTSIGDGVERARMLLNPVTGYDVKAMIVLTDGQENTPKYISEVMDSINDRVFAIGLGTPEAINPVALTALTNSTGGYLLMTGTLDNDDFFRLSKYYLQILAGVTNNQIVLDPEGWIASGQVHRIPFSLSETDISSDIILLTPAPQALRFTLETPNGQIIDPNVASGNPGILHVISDNVSYYRLTLPTLVDASESREGIWYAILSFGDIIEVRDAQRVQAVNSSVNAQARGIRYSLNVHAYSNLRMRSSLSQNSQKPGATLTLRAVLSEYGLPVEARATLRAEMERPDKSTTTLTLAEVEPGVFETITVAAMPGIYHFRTIGTGATLQGNPFTREQILTGAVWKEGDNPLPSSKDDQAECCRRTVPLLRLGIGLLVLLVFLAVLSVILLWISLL